jgi:hypothetical protein
MLLTEGRSPENVKKGVFKVCGFFILVFSSKSQISKHLLLLFNTNIIGTFLQSSLSQNSDGERNIAADDSNEIMILDGDNETSFMLVDDEFKEDTELEGSYKLEAVKVSAIHQDESPRQQMPTESTPPMGKKRAASQAESVQNEALSLIEDFDGDFDGFANKCSTRELKRMRDIIDKHLEMREDTD